MLTLQEFFMLPPKEQCKNFLCHYWQLLLLGFLLEVFFGYLRSTNIDGVEKSYIIPTLASYIAPYLALYMTASLGLRKQNQKP